MYSKKNYNIYIQFLEENIFHTGTIGNAGFRAKEK
jgi:hypothetical protein